MIYDKVATGLDDTLGTNEVPFKDGPFRVFIGYDPRDAAAYRVAEASLRKHASIDIKIIPLIDRDLRRRGIYWRSYRVDHVGQMWDDNDAKPFSTEFSFTRFAVPIIEDYADRWVLFTDPDVLWRADVAELVRAAEGSRHGVMCVKHDHRPRENEKMDGVLQTRYERKNWSSVMMINPSRCRRLTKYYLNNMSGGQLHALTWIEEDGIGALGEEWNWLEGWSNPGVDPKLVHFTRGTPDMPGHEDAAHADEWRAEFAEVLGGLVSQWSLPVPAAA